MDDDNSNKMKPPTLKTTKKPLIGMVILGLLVIIFAGAYILQSRHVNKDNQQLSNLNSSNSSLKKQTTKLSQQLNAANQTVSSLAETNSFVSGATCQTQQLKLNWEQTLSGGFGGDGGVFSYQNTSNTTCTLDGYPGFLALSSSGQVMPDGSIGTATNLGTKANAQLLPTLITLAPNNKDYFVVEWGSTMGAESQSDCLIPSLIESTPPGGTIPIIETINNGPTLCNKVGPVSALAPLKDFEFSTSTQ